MIKIPIDPALFSQSVEMNLDGISYEISTRYQQRDDSYFLDVATSDGKPVFSGFRVVVDLAIGSEIRGLLEPAGRFFAYDASGKRLDPKKGELGSRVLLFYVTSAEIAELVNA